MIEQLSYRAKQIEELYDTKFSCRVMLPRIEAPSQSPFGSRLPLELASNALSDKRDVSPAVAVLSRDLGQLVAAAEHASAPASPSKVNVRVAVEHIQLFADSFQAARVGCSTTSFSQDRLPLVLA